MNPSSLNIIWYVSIHLLIVPRPVHPQTDHTSCKRCACTLRTKCATRTARRKFPSSRSPRKSPWSCWWPPISSIAKQNAINSWCDTNRQPGTNEQLRELNHAVLGDLFLIFVFKYSHCIHTQTRQTTIHKTIFFANIFTYTYCILVLNYTRFKLTGGHRMQKVL